MLSLWLNPAFMGVKFSMEELISSTPNFTAIGAACCPCGAKTSLAP